MGPREFQVILDSPVYHAGQYVEGKLLIELKKAKKMKGLYVKYYGKGLVQWSEGWGTTTVTHSNTEIYLMSHQLVFGDGVEERELAEGRHVFDFSYQLPTELPCSFEGLLGRISYSVRVVVDEPWKNDYVAKQSVKIISIFDLNNCPLAPTPIEERTSKTFWGQSKPLSMSVDIPVRGFVPGQIIPVKVILNNESEVQVKSITATMKQSIVFHTAMKSSPMKIFLLRTYTPVEKGFGCHEANFGVQVPALPPSYLQLCSIIDLRYELTVKAKVSGCHRSLKIPMEIIIGNVPLVAFESSDDLSQRFLRGGPLTPENPRQDYRPPPYAVVFPPARTYEDLPPPPYEQTTEPGDEEVMNPGAEIREFPPLYSANNFGTSKT